MKKSILSLLSLLTLNATFNLAYVHADSEPFVGEIMYVPFNFCPKGWAMADGQLLPLSQNTALFSLLGTNYGGNGKSNFALPDLQGRFAVGIGQGPGLSLVDVGQMDGQENLTLNESQIPQHNHRVDTQSPFGNGKDTLTLQQPLNLSVSNALAEERVPRNHRIAQTAQNQYTSLDTLGNDSLASVKVNLQATKIQTTSAGGGQAFSKMPPYLVLNACIALQGIFPPRP
jgi:microcystin-dependent protein